MSRDADITSKSYIDGNSAVKYVNPQAPTQKYLAYRLMSEDGTMLCTFFGPMSLSAAGTFSKALAEGTNISPVEASKLMRWIYEPRR